MNKSFIPYNLRQNKAIDRNLFIELLYKINRYFPIEKYEYISMGGPFLEDFKSIHAGTGIAQMISFEMDKNTYLRQKFNQPLSCIDLKNKKSSDFILEYDFPNKTVIWLDFTTPSHLASDLNDIYQLMGKLRAGDIVKVTLNAHAATLPSKDVKNDLEKTKKRLEYLDKLIGDYLPSDTEKEMLTHNKYPKLLFDVLKLVFDKGMEGNKREYFQTLTSFVYADGQQLMTFAGIILERTEMEKFLVNTEINNWDLYIGNNPNPVSINVPDLSIKERMSIDSYLPKNTPKEIQGKLEFHVAPSEKESLVVIENYVRYYKQFPYFSKVVL